MKFLCIFLLAHDLNESLSTLFRNEELFKVVKIEDTGSFSIFMQMEVPKGGEHRCQSLSGKIIAIEFVFEFNPYNFYMLIFALLSYLIRLCGVETEAREVIILIHFHFVNV